MPRIRKKTSNRGTTHQRNKIKEKARETRKKNKRDAKRNPQWKSKTPKDPGIPNSFPFKDQILAEIAEARRKEDEEKAARKEAKKSAKAQAAAAAAGQSADADGSGSKDETGLGGISAMTLIARTTSASSAKGKEKALALEIEEEEVPALVNPDLPHLRSVLSAADVVLHVLDARDPLSHLSTSLEAFCSSNGKKLLYVLNKIDTVPRETLSAWASHLRQRYPTFYFRSASAFLPPPENVPLSTKPKPKEPVDDAIGSKAILALLTKWATEQPEGTPLTVAVVGVANTGKSAFVSSLARRATTAIYRTPPLSAPSTTPTTTPHPVEVPLELAAAGRTIKLIDTPGLSFASPAAATAEGLEERRALDILLRSKGRVDRMKNPVPPVVEIVKRANQTDLMLFYGLPAYAKDDVDALLTTISRVNKLVKKGGVLDLTAAARLVLRDWAIGRLPRSAMPPKLDSSTTDDLHVDDERTLANVPTRVECRKASGIVRMTAGSEDTREPEWEAPWVRVAAPREDAEDDAEGDQDMKDVEDDVSSGTNADEETEVEEELDTEGEPDESDEDEEEEEAPPPVKRKRKADVAPPTAPAPKKVAFSKTPKGPSVQATDFAAPKSVLKVKSAKETTKPKPSVTQARRKLAAAKSDGAKKAPTKGKSTKAQTAGSKEGGAYEFGEFF